MIAPLPQLTRAPVRPTDIVDGRWIRVVGGATMMGRRADALMSLNEGEDRRRQAVGMSAIPDLGLLDILMALPLGAAVPLRSLSDRELRILDEAPPGIVQYEGESVTRVLAPPVEVQAAVVTNLSWRRAIRVASAFAPVCQRIVCFGEKSRQLSSRLWEADLLGIGVWRCRGDVVEELLAPQAFQLRYVKPARWRFQENCYGTYVSARHPLESSSEGTGRRARTSI